MPVGECTLEIKRMRDISYESQLVNVRFTESSETFFRLSFESFFWLNSPITPKISVPYLRSKDSNVSLRKETNRG